MVLDTATQRVPLDTDSDGVVRIAKTRVTLDTVIGAFLEGATAEEISFRYPSLGLADVYDVIAYYLRHRSKVHEYLHWRTSQIDHTKRENEARFDPVGIRERLIARSR